MPWATAMMHTPLPAESASHTSSGTRTIWRTSSRASSSGGSSLPAGVRDPARVAWRWAKSTKQRNSGSMTTPCVPGATRYRVPRAAANRAASNGRAAGPATMAATEGTATQVRDLAMVMRMLSGLRPSRVASANTERSTEDAAGWWARAEPPMASPERLAQSQMSRTVRPDRAAACSSADSASAALSCQKAMSPLPPARGPISASARVNASAGSWHPATGSHPKVDGTLPIPNGLNTWTRPRRHRVPAVLMNRSARVEVAMTAPGQSSIQSASAPDLPLRGGASSSQLASIVPSTRLPHWARPRRMA